MPHHLPLTLVTAEHVPPYSPSKQTLGFHWQGGGRTFLTRAPVPTAMAELH